MSTTSRTTAHRWLITGLVVATVACTGGPSSTPSDAREAAAISRQLRAAPQRTEQILADAGTNAKAFEARLYAISKDPDASAAYAEAMAD